MSPKYQNGSPANHRVRVIGHCGEWTVIYSSEFEAIREAILPARAFIEHVGSTAIAKLDSKPVIDILVSLVDWREVENAVKSLSSLGYRDRDVPDKTARRFLIKSIPNSEFTEEIHLHLTPVGSDWGNNMSVFRDELIGNDALASRYQALKHELARSNPTNLDAYTTGKGEFVRQVLRAAAGAFGNDRMLTHQRAELDRSQTFQRWTILAQLSVAVVAAVSVYVEDNGELLKLAIVGFVLACAWLGLAYKQRAHRAAGDQARRVVLLASGLGHHFSAEQRLRIFDKFSVSTENLPVVREEGYFASRSEPGYRRLAELIEESAYWTRDLQKSSGTALLSALIVAFAIMATALWLGVTNNSSSSTVSIARVLVAFLVFLLSSDIVGAIFAHFEAANTIGEILQRAETAAARGYETADVLLLMSDYNGAVESAPFAFPGVFKFRRSALTRRWRAYLETKRR